jgi:hypothetical protein
MIQRLCAIGQTSQLGTGYSTQASVHAYLQLVQQTSSHNVSFASPEACTHILSDQYDLALKLIPKLLRTPGSPNLQWLFLLPTRRPQPAVLVWDVIGIDFINQQIDYFSPAEDTMNCIPPQLASTQKFISHITAPVTANERTWATSVKTISGITPEYYGTWACLLTQVLLHRLSPSIISNSSLVDSGLYIAACLVQKSIPSFKSLLVQASKQDKVAHYLAITDSTVLDSSSPPPEHAMRANDHSPDIYYPRQDELQGVSA